MIILGVIFVLLTLFRYYECGFFKHAPWVWGIRSLRLGGILGYDFPKPDGRMWGYEHFYYDGDFHAFGFWYFHICWITNPHCYLTQAEIHANIEAWYTAHPEHRPKE